MKTSMTDITKNPEKNLNYLNNVDSQQSEELLVMKTELTAMMNFVLEQFLIIKKIFARTKRCCKYSSKRLCRITP